MNCVDMRKFRIITLLFFFVFLSASCMHKQKEEKKQIERTDSVDIPSLIEIVTCSDYKMDSTIIFQICKEENISVDVVFCWKNHWLLFDSFNKKENIQLKVKNYFPSAKLKFYETPYYNFNRKVHCNDDENIKEWHHIIMSANLVEDSVMQNEYFDYHKNQFKDWPEISGGFCNADFQQLLMYHNNRQLMLIISIPKGKSLAELNPKTEENNPRVAEWNALMEKYQEPLPDAGKDEVWVVFNSLNSDDD